MKKRVYSTEFKSSAVQLSYERENIKELADELGIQVERIYKWRSSQKTFTNPVSIVSLKAETDSIEVKRLRKELKEKELEARDIKKGRSHLFQERWEVYQFIVSYKHLYPIEKMCKVLKVSRSSYYRWFSCGPSNRSLENSLFTDLIKEVFDLSSQTYGSPRIAQELKRKGYRISKRKVAKLMRFNGWKSKLKKRFKVTTDSNHPYPVCRNHLNRNFTPKSLNEVWVSDITYIKTAAGWLYLTTIIDLYDRQVIGWSLSTRMYTNQTVIPAWKMAISKREITESLLFHSDRGIQYASIEFRKLINKNTLITQSMSRKANCWDNAVAESFFKTIKVELIYQHEFKTIEEAKLAVFEYIEVWYNRKRLHSSLGYKTPNEMELEFYKIKSVA